MKKVLFISIALILFGILPACNSDDDHTTPPQTVEDPIEEDPIEDVVERTDRLLDYTWDELESLVTHSIEYTNDTLTKYSYGSRSGTRNLRVEAVEAGMITTAWITFGSQGGVYSFEITFTYNGEWIEHLHSEVYVDGELYVRDIYFEQNGNLSILSEPSENRVWEIEYDEQRRWLSVQSSVYSANFTYENGNLKEVAHASGELRTYEYDIRHNPVYLEGHSNFTYINPILYLLYGTGRNEPYRYDGLETNLNNVLNYTVSNGSSNNSLSFTYEYDEFDFPISRATPETGQPDLNYVYLE